jgi:hypothetical protein
VRGGHTQRIQKTLEDANIKLDLAVSDILGLSGRLMIEALIDGQTNPGDLAHRRLQASGAELEAALRGRVTAHHRFLLGLRLEQIDALDAAMAGLCPKNDESAGKRRSTRMKKGAPPNLRAALMMRYGSSEHWAEVAAKTATSTDAIRKRCGRYLDRLRRKLGILA